jgi:hypothetical protein
MFPGSFVLDMVTPLNFAHLNDLITSQSLCRVQDFNWSLTLGLITSQVKLFFR